jgi:hypothetical protein
MQNEILGNGWASQRENKVVEKGEGSKNLAMDDLA